MKFLEKIWVRIIISIIGGGMVTEIIHISTGDPNRPMTTNLSLIFAGLIYVVITLIFTVIKNRGL